MEIRSCTTTNLFELKGDVPRTVLWLAHNLKSYKDMFFLCTEHSMAQDLEENVVMTDSLTFFSRLTSNLKKADPDICMRSSKDGTHCEYIAVYVDGLAISMTDPQAFCDTLKKKYKLKLKRVGPLRCHLGCGYTRDEH